MIPIFAIAFSLLLPAYAIHRSTGQKPVVRPYMYSCASFAFCCCGILQEIITIKRRLFSGDIGGIEDTIGGVIILCIVFIIAVVLINLALLGLSHEK